MTPRKQFEARVGERGLRINLVLQGLSQSDFWSTKAKTVSSLLYEGKENEIGQAVERLAQTWRWWADSLGYFNRKVDAHNFYTEVLVALKNGSLLPELSHWQSAGIKTVYGLTGTKDGSWYVDPETEDAKPNPDHLAHPKLLTDTNTFYLELNADTAVTTQLIRLAVIIADVSISMGAYPDKDTAEMLFRSRPIQLSFPSNPGAELTQIALACSAELAAIFPEQHSRREKQKTNHPYTDFLLAKFGQRNEIEVKVTKDIPYLELSGLGTTPVTQELIANPVETIKEKAPAEFAIAKPVPAAEQKWNDDLGLKTAAKQVEPAETKTLAVAEQENTLHVAGKAWTVQKVTVGINLLVISVQTEAGVPLEVHCLIHRAPIHLQNQVNTILRIANRALQAGVSPAEVATEMVEETFPPAGSTDDPEISEITSVVDYLGKLLQQF